MSDLEEFELAVLDTPVDEIPPAKLFIPVPLQARMTKGIDTVRDFAIKQREIVTKASVIAAQKGERPPESRIRCDNFKKV